MNVLASDRGRPSFKPAIALASAQNGPWQALRQGGCRRLICRLARTKGSEIPRSVRLNLLSFTIGTSHPGRVPHAFSHPPAHRLY
jgi:hypothetical protein